MKKEIIVVRYGHRHVRDYRVTTHCCLVSRAMGAQKIIILGEKDEKLLESIKKVNENWGKGIEVEFSQKGKQTLKKLKKAGYTIIHLTMYGLNINDVEKELENKKKIVLIIGSQKVEPWVYAESDINIGIGNQPHSEIAALAIALDRLGQGKELNSSFKNAKIAIIGNTKGKKIYEKQK